MPAGSILKSVLRERCWLSILLLQIMAGPLPAAEFPRVVGHPPPPVARGTVTPQGRVPGTNQLQLALSLPLRQLGELTKLLSAIYNPGAPQYHHYLAPREFAARFGPTPADYAAVLEFARTNGLRVTATHSNRLLVDVVGRVADVERALHVKLYSFRHPSEPRNFFAPDTAPSVEARLPLLQVSGLDNFSRAHSQISTYRPALPSRWSPQDGSGPGSTFMGNDFRQAYVPGSALTGAGQSVALVEFDEFSPDDIPVYENLIGLTNNPPSVTVMPVDGGVNYPEGASGEVVLDIEMALAMAPGLTNIYVYEATNGSPWVHMLSQMAEDNLASQISCSWNGGGPDPASEQIFQQMAAQGQSFFVASGDSGAYSGEMQFPCASPNITVVGGTSLATDTNGNYSYEAAWNLGSGGSALSVGMPIWQYGLDMTTNGGSTFWRNIPDVSLTAADVYVCGEGWGGVIAGTSCAAPLWAAFTALANQQAAQLGLPPVGFLNPAIYSLCRGSNYTAAFHDITIGNNLTSPGSTDYFAVPGFDLCTGWGTPTGTNLINALTMPDPLGILPQNVFFTSGLVGGSFPQTNWLLMLTNAGTGNLDWSLGGLPDWLTVSSASGTLTANAATNLLVQWVNPNSMPAGGYCAALMLTNEDLSRVQNALVQIQIGSSTVANGGFETGDFTGWMLTGDTVNWFLNSYEVCNVVATDADYPGVAHSGNFGAHLGQKGYAATLAQAVPTIPGQSYLVSFWLDDLQAAGFPQFGAAWDGATMVDLVSQSSFDWTNFQFLATANDTNATIEFAAENDQGYFGLDDITVTPVPPVSFSGCGFCTNGFQLTWPALAALNYQVQSTTDLAQGNWITNVTIAAVTNLTTFVDTNPPPDSAQDFYRLVLLPP